MLDQSDNVGYFFFGCVIISDLYLFQKIILSNPSFIFSKSFILLFTGKLTSGA